MKNIRWYKTIVNVVALLALVFFFTALTFALPGLVDKQVVWDANTEEDLAGYRLYYRAETEVFSNDRYFLVPPEIQAYRLADVPFNTHMALTAFDSSGNESEFSKEVIYLPFDRVAPVEPSGVQILRIE